MTRWGGYPRISEDPNDLRAGMDRQHDDIGEEVTRRKGDAKSIVWYDENNTSAYKKKRIEVTDPMGNKYLGYRVVRPKWHQALHDLRTKKINGLVVWDLDRLARDPRDLEDAIEAVEYYGATIVSATASEIDLTTESGRMTARLFVLIANKASADTARRVKRAHLASAREGKPVGGFRPFGWNEDKATLHPQESKAMREVIKKITSGVPTRTLVAELNEKGFLTTAGKEWTPATLRQYLKNPRLVGYRTHNRAILLDEKGKPVVGQWKPLVDQETYDKLQTVLVKPEGRARTPKRNARHYLLTGILRCGVCSAPMYGNAHEKGGGYFYYKCNAEKPYRHSNNASGGECDRIISRLVLARLASESFDTVQAPWPGEAALQDAEQKIEELMDAYMNKRLSGDRVFGRVEKLEVEVAQMRNDRAQWLAETTGPAVARVTHEEWKVMDTDEQRAWIEKVLEAVYVRPATRRGNQFDVDRLDPVPRKRPGQPSLRAVPS